MLPSHLGFKTKVSFLLGLDSLQLAGKIAEMDRYFHTLRSELLQVQETDSESSTAFRDARDFLRKDSKSPVKALFLAVCRHASRISRDAVFILNPSLSIALRISPM